MRELAVQETKNVDGGIFFVIYPERFSNGTVSSVTFGNGSLGSLSGALPSPVESGPVSSGIGFSGPGTGFLGFLRSSSRHVSIGTVNVYNVVQKVNL
ncbi:MAG TPA: hypothetical protein ACQGQI_04075 [Xylella sp.]